MRKKNVFFFGIFVFSNISPAISGVLGCFFALFISFTGRYAVFSHQQNADMRGISLLFASGSANAPRPPIPLDRLHFSICAAFFAVTDLIAFRLFCAWVGLSLPILLAPQATLRWGAAEGRLFLASPRRAKPAFLGAPQDSTHRLLGASTQKS